MPSHLGGLHHFCLLWLIAVGVPGARPPISTHVLTPSTIARQLLIRLLTDRVGAPTTPSMGNDNAVYVASICAAVSLVALGWRWQQNGARPPYPPGPRSYPLIGGVLSVPRGVPIWQAFASVSQKYSECSVPAGGYLQFKMLSLLDTDVLYVKIFSTDYIILNSSEVISDLLEKRSAIYSDIVSHSSICSLLRPY